MEPNVILKYKRPTDSWLCPTCDCENKMNNESCSVCGSAKPAYPVLVNAWNEADEKRYTQKPVSAQKKPASTPQRKASARTATSPKAAPSYTPVRDVVFTPPKKKSGSKIAVVILTIILIAAIILTAMFIINNSGDFSHDTVDENEVTYQEAMDEYNDDNFEKAIELFDSLPEGYKDSSEMLTETKYMYALELMKEDDTEKIEKARTIFEELGDYEDSDYQRKECIYKLAEKQLKEENYEEALKLFESIPAHEDADDKVKLCKYNYAIDLYRTGEYEKAEGIFREIDPYEDSQEYLLECAYARADEYIEVNDFVEAMKIVYDSTSGNLDDTKFVLIQNSLRSYNYSRNYFPGSNSLLGNWKTSSGDNLNYYSNGNGGVTCQTSMPYTSADKFYVEYGQHFHTINYSDQLQWVIQRVSSNSIKVFNYRNGKIYNFTK